VFEHYLECKIENAYFVFAPSEEAHKSVRWEGDLADHFRIKSAEIY